MGVGNLLLLVGPFAAVKRSMYAAARLQRSEGALPFLAEKGFFCGDIEDFSEYGRPLCTSEQEVREELEHARALGLYDGPIQKVLDDIALYGSRIDTADALAVQRVGPQELWLRAESLLFTLAREKPKWHILLNTVGTPSVVSVAAMYEKINPRDVTVVASSRESELKYSMENLVRARGSAVWFA